MLCMKTSNKGSNDKHGFVASLTLVNCFICDAMFNKAVYLLCPISVTRQMLGASWGEPECVFEVNKIYWHLYGINRHV